MAVRFCHTAYLTRDLEKATQRLYDEHGLATYDAGVSDEQGMAFRMIPMGDSYFEFIHPIEGMEHGGLASTMHERFGPNGGDAFTGWYFRTDTLEELEQIGERLGYEPTFSLGRTTPDGYQIEVWGLGGFITKFLPAFNFSFIHWPKHEQYPGIAYSAPHKVQPIGFEWIELGGDESHQQMIRDFLSDDGGAIDVRFVGGKPGIRAVALATEKGPVEIRP